MFPLPAPVQPPAPTPVTAADLRLLVRLVRGDHTRVSRMLAERPDGLDRLARIAIRGGLSVVLLRALSASSLHVTPALVAAMEDRRRRQHRRQKRLMETLDRLARHLEKANLPFILLKGPYLAARFYGDVDGREFLDIDLLVPSRARIRACGLLTESGFRRGSRVFLGDILTSVFVHGFDFVADEANLDLHWALSRHVSLHLNEQAIWSRRAGCSLAGRRYAVLGDGDEVVFAVLGLMRDIERARPKMKSLLDLLQIVAAVDARLEWEDLLHRARWEGTRGPLVNVLSLCLELADVHDLAPRLTTALSRQRVRRVGVHDGSSPLRFWPRHLGLGNKLWVARAYDSSLAEWLLWWTASLPFRVAVHRWRKGPAPFSP